MLRSAAGGSCLFFLASLTVLYNADDAVSFKDGEGDFVDRADVLGSRSRHDVFRIDAHTLHDLELPFALLEQSEWSAIDHRAEAGKLTFNARYHPMHEPDCKNRSGAIDDRAIFAYRAQDDDTTDQEDDHKLEKSHLPTGASAKHAHHEQKEEVTENGVENGSQFSSP